MFCLNVQRLIDRADGTGAAGYDYRYLIACRYIGGVGVGLAIEQRTLGILHSDLRILTRGNVNDIIIRSVLGRDDFLGRRWILGLYGAIGTCHNIGHIAGGVEGRILNADNLFCNAGSAGIVGQGLHADLHLNIFIRIGVTVFHRKHTIGEGDVLDLAPTVNTILGIVELTVVPIPAASVCTLVDVLRNVVRQAFQHNLLSCTDCNHRPGQVLRWRNLIQNCQRLRLGHGVAVFRTIEEIILCQDIDMLVGIQIDFLTVDVHTCQVPLHSQLAQIGSNQLRGSVHLAVKLGGEQYLAGIVLLDVDDQAAISRLDQVQRIRNLVSRTDCLVYYRILRQADALQADVINRAGEDDGIACAAQTQNWHKAAGAVLAGIDEALLGCRIIIMLLTVAIIYKGRVIPCTNMLRLGLRLRCKRTSQVRQVSVLEFLAYCVNQSPVRQDVRTLINDVVLCPGATELIQRQTSTTHGCHKVVLIHQQRLIIGIVNQALFLRTIGFILMLQVQSAGSHQIDGDAVVKDVNVESFFAPPPFIVVIQRMGIDVFRVGITIVMERSILFECLKGLAHGADTLYEHLDQLCYITIVQVSIFVLVDSFTIRSGLEILCFILVLENIVSVFCFLHHFGYMNCSTKRIALVVTILLCILPIAFRITCDGLGIGLVSFLNDGNAGAIHCNVQHIVHCHCLARKHVTVCVHGLLLEGVRLVLDIAVRIQHAKLVVLNTVDRLVGRLVCKAGIAYIAGIYLELVSVQHKQAVAQVNRLCNFLSANIDHSSVIIDVHGVAGSIRHGVAVFVLLFVEGLAVIGFELHTGEGAFIGDGSGDFDEAVVVDGKRFLDCSKGSGIPLIVRPPGDVSYLSDAEGITTVHIGIQPHILAFNFNTCLGCSGVVFLPEDVIEWRIGIDNGLTKRCRLHIERSVIVVVGVVCTITHNTYRAPGSQEVGDRKVITVCLDSDIIDQMGISG